MKSGLILITLLLVTGCAKHESAASRDSIFVQPKKDTVAAPTYNDLQSGLWIDSSIVRQEADKSVLKRFEPKQIMEIYEAYRPLRTLSTTPAQLDSFLAAQKITAKELHSVLAEGDRLGWSKAH
jgi:hypothetical protein